MRSDTGQQIGRRGGPRWATRCAALAVALATLTGCAGGWVQGSGNPRASSSGSVAPTTTAAATPAGSPTGPQATGAPAPAPAPSGAGIPAGLLLPNEGERGTSPDVTDWTTDETDSAPWLFDPCRPTAYPTDHRRTDFRTVSRTGPEFLEARQLATYRDAAVATEVMAGFRRVLAACATGGDPAQGDAWTWVSADVPGVGDDAFVAGGTIGGPTSASTGSRLAVVRVGSLVFLAYAADEFRTAELDGAADDARQVARAFVDSL